MSELTKDTLPVPVLPSRGAKHGVRQDVSRSKEGSYNPVGTGTAWSHNFLNQKPWHPLNFRNQIKKYEHEQKAIQDFKTKEAAMAEWQAEQERQATLAFLSPAEAARQRDRASIQFMYQKPPGLEAALARDRELADKKQREQAAAAAAVEAGDGSQQQLQPGSAAPGSAAAAAEQAQQREQQQEALRQRQQQLDRLREDPFAAILQARSALQKSEKFVMKTVEGAFGGVAPGSENQLLLGDGEEEEQQQGGGEIDEAEALLASLDPAERQAVLAALDKKRRRAEKAARLEQAQELLRSAGIDPAAAAAADAGGGSSRSHKRHRKESSKHSKRHKEPSSSKHSKHKKQKKSHKEGRSRRGSGSGSSSGSDSDRR
ncbi:hypothetical protein OEZ85_004103 [Tetradesmus obliquus]|uniref:CBF1-interacting co-repressor CIR N-terminal domain-containing protein n=1 Tax=Tetradesmus obliquus TaxID=3088 RepID=A0ABY8UDC0_TETOB|nr:hypothetical protein OEZ85_004103 [Tetradesmus obliquus]